MRTASILLALALALAACKPMKSTVTDYRYFEKNLDSLSKTVISLQEPRIQKHDQLNITVSSATLNQEQTVVFNLTSGGGAGGVSGGGGSMGGAGGVMGYLVDYDGTISLPIVGKVMAEGLTKNQLADTLVKRLEPYVKNPILNIRFLNYRVMLIGETRQQGWVTFSNEKATIVDAIMQGGGLTDQGERSGILLIRTQPGGQVETHRLDMNDAMIYQSPYFQLQQNDIIYVLPNESRLLAYQRSNSPFFRDLPLYLGLITSILAFATLIISLTQ